MKTSRLVVKSLGTAYGENPDYVALLASSDTESVEVVFETMKVPVVAASIISTAQDALKRMDPATVPSELAWNFESSTQIMPDLIGVQLTAGGDVLCLNIGTGGLFFKLTESELKKL